MKASTAEISQRKLHVEEGTRIHENIRMCPVREKPGQSQAVQHWKPGIMTGSEEEEYQDFSQSISQKNSHKKYPNSPSNNLKCILCLKGGTSKTRHLANCTVLIRPKDRKLTYILSTCQRHTEMLSVFVWSVLWQPQEVRSHLIRDHHCYHIS